MIKIIVAGFKGRMGSTATQMVLETADFELVGVYDPHEAQETVSFNDETAIPVFQRLEEVLAVKPDVWIDFTVPEAAYPNTRFALEHGMAPVVGTTGFTEEQINELTNLSRESHRRLDCAKFCNWGSFNDAICPKSGAVFSRCGNH